MPSITIIFSSESQTEGMPSALAGMQDAPPPLTGLDRGLSALDLRGAGPPPLATIGMAGDAGSLEELKGAGPPPVSGGAAATCVKQDDDLKGAGPPSVPGVTGACASPGSTDALGDAGPPSIMPPSSHPDRAAPAS